VKALETLELHKLLEVIGEASLRQQFSIVAKTATESKISEIYEPIFSSRN